MQVEREGHRSHSSVGRVVAQRLGSGGRYDCNVGKTNSISEALRELGLQLWRKISGIGRKSSARDEEWDELDQVAAELEAEAGVGEEYEEGEESEADEEGEDDDERGVVGHRKGLARRIIRHHSETIPSRLSWHVPPTSLATFRDGLTEEGSGRSIATRLVSRLRSRPTRESFL